ncbi:BRO-N domain-containing protein [Symbiopectobacterium purcellii]|uniref:BRO-N domain-containing protein n=1 Tax=Symbiopectobacterium purcellii TaxID=2871826 RepID=UPI003F87A537
MADLSIQPISFSFRETHDIRIHLINAEPWFCLKDVCEVLTVDRTSKLLRELDRKGWANCHTLTEGGEQQLVYVNEPNLYRIIFRSNKPEAKQFQNWVFDDVLPTIRKTGKYVRPTHKPEAREPLTSDDTSHLARLIWGMANGFRFERSCSNAIWHALRYAAGVPSPQHFGVSHIPILAEECQRIYSFTNALKEVMYDAERQAVRRVLKNREDADAVV